MKTSQRYLALDVLRGLTIALMITVNNPGSWSHVYAPLRHSEWHGCTPTDLVFPFFLFVVGVSMFFSFSKYENKLNKDSFWRIIRRAFLIFIIGLFLNSFPQWMQDWSKVRILGVLQRIAIAYGIGSLIVLSVRKKYLPLLGAAILLLYWGILYWFGGADPYSLKENATPGFDAAILGDSHMYHGFGITFDPEGVLSTIPAIVTVILGYLMGNMIVNSEKKKVPLNLLIYGIGGILVGLAWGMFFPINKPLWTSTYVLYTAGWACLVLSLLVWIIDLKGYTKWTTFFVVFGMNPLILYALSGLFARILIKLVHWTDADGKVGNGISWLYLNVFQPFAGDINGSLLYALSNVLVLWAIGYVLYKKKIFIKV